MEISWKHLKSPNTEATSSRKWPFSLFWPTPPLHDHGASRLVKRSLLNVALLNAGHLAAWKSLRRYLSSWRWPVKHLSSFPRVWGRLVATGSPGIRGRQGALTLSMTRTARCFWAWGEPAGTPALPSTPSQPSHIIRTLRRDPLPGHQLTVNGRTNNYNPLPLVQTLGRFGSKKASLDDCSCGIAWSWSPKKTASMCSLFWGCCRNIFLRSIMNWILLAQFQVYNTEIIVLFQFIIWSNQNRGNNLLPTHWSTTYFLTRF